MTKVEVIGLKFTKRNIYGDFSWMINSEEYNDSLFIYNDNIESFYNKTFKRAGLGNAVIRPYRFTNPVRAMPIPTGSLSSGGFGELTEGNKRIIDNSISDIRNLILKGGYTKIYFSMGDDGLIGMSIFKIDPNVRKYITDQLYSLTIF